MRICASVCAVLLLAAGVTIFAASQHTAAEPAGPLSARASATNPPGGTPPTLLRVDSSLVLIPVHVTTAAGGTVTGLPRDAFQLFEDDAQQTIASFFTEDAPVSVGILFDSSGSMRPKIHKSAEAAAAFFRTSNPDDEFFLIQFADRAHVVVPFTTDSGEIFNQIARTHPMGRTSLIDAIYLGCAQMKRSARHQRRALVIFSDGGDNWSRHSLAEIRDLLLESDVQVYAMGIFDFDYMHNHSIEERNGPALLDELTTLTGGRHFPVDDLDQLPEISERIGRELHSQYLLGYYPTNAARDGKYRHVKVVLHVPNATELHTSYRTGYYGPAQ